MLSMFKQAMKSFNKSSIKLVRTPYAIMEGQDDHRDRGDCTVRTFALVMDCSYEKSRMFMAANGREYRQGMSLNQLKSIFTNLKKSKTEIFENPKVTVEKFIEQHPEGRFYVVIDKHAIAIIDGVLYNWDDCGKEKVIWACRVHLNSEVGDESNS